MGHGYKTVMYKQGNMDFPVEDVAKVTVSFWKATRLGNSSVSMADPFCGVDNALLQSLDDMLNKCLNETKGAK